MSIRKEKRKPGMGVTAVAEQTKIGRPLLYETPEAMQAVIDAYFTECRETKNPVTMSGLADALDMDRHTLLAYEGREPFTTTVKRARRKVEVWTEKALHGNRPVGPIFSLKNNFGWKDTQEVEHHHMLLAIGQPGSVPAQLEPPVIEVSPLPAIEPEAKVAQITEDNG